MAQEYNKKFIGTEARPRVSVFRSNARIYAQAIDDANGKTLVSVSSDEIKESKKPTELAALAGKLLAQKAKDAKITKVIFDRNRFRYHGRVKAFADGMREGGLQF